MRASLLLSCKIPGVKVQPRIKYRQVQYFLAVAETLHFSKAAESLFVTQPTLSHQLAELEAQIGMPLFDRAKGVVRLTQAGEVFRDYAQRSMDAMAEGYTALTELEGLQRGDLKLGVTQSFIRRLMPPIIGEFRRNYPAVTLQILDLTASQIESQLAEGSIDLGIAFAPAMMDDTEVETILEERMILFVRKEHPLAINGSVSWRQLTEHPLVLLSRSYSTRQLIDGYFRETGVLPSIACETNTIELMVGLATETDLAAILPERTVEKSEDMSIIPIIDPVPVRISALMWSRHRYRTLAAQTFAGFVRERFSRTIVAD